MTCRGLNLENMVNDEAIIVVIHVILSLQLMMCELAHCHDEKVISGRFFLFVPSKYPIMITNMLQLLFHLLLIKVATTLPADETLFVIYGDL